MDGDISRTATAIRALAMYAPAGRKAEAQRRIDRAAAWIATAPTKNIDGMNMQLLGLEPSGARGVRGSPGCGNYPPMQRPDGGWGQTANLASEPTPLDYALYHARTRCTVSRSLSARVCSTVQTQAADGSWYVKSRAPKFQLVLDTIFPYGHDQWISSWATAWSATALSYASGVQQIAKR